MRPRFSIFILKNYWSVLCVYAHLLKDYVIKRCNNRLEYDKTRHLSAQNYRTGYDQEFVDIQYFTVYIQKECLIRDGRRT